MTGAALAALALAVGLDQPASSVDAVVVTQRARQLNDLKSVSQGVVTRAETLVRPTARSGQVLEVVPGLVATTHTGGGKADQFFLRGFNLDHGTDFAVGVDGMPVNAPSHGHGQGYLDLNFLIPELSGDARFRKGPYDAADGDFAAAGALSQDLVDELDPQASASAGSLDDQRLFIGGSRRLGRGRLLIAGELVHSDGPWTRPDDLRKANAAVRWSWGGSEAGGSVTALYYRAKWFSTSDVPQRAVDEGRIGRFGTIDPTDGGQAERFSLSGRWRGAAAGWSLKGDLYAVRSQLTLWNDFTHFLVDPIDGDQNEQNDRRTTLGGAVSVTRPFGRLEGDIVFGLQGRYDRIYLDLRYTSRRRVLERIQGDRIDEGGGAAYAAANIRWSPWFRTSAGVRANLFVARARSTTPGASGTPTQLLVQPKAAIVLGPWRTAELFLNAGGGFHSNDVRSVVSAAPQGDGSPSSIRAPLMSRSTGAEVGLRVRPLQSLELTAALFSLSTQSDLAYDADAGATAPGRPSLRRGLELSATWRPRPWLQLETTATQVRSRYTDDDPAGSFITDAPRQVASAGVTLLGPGRLTGSVQLRYFSGRPLLNDNSVRSGPTREVNASMGYRLTANVRLRLDVFNLFDVDDQAINFFYRSRLLGEPMDGVEGLQIHPLAPRAARFEVRWFL